jgi:signal transduction histidine kinase
METPLLHKVLEQEKISALLANFAQLLSGSLWTCLVDVEGKVVGSHPVGAQEISPAQLLFALDAVRQFERLTSVPTGMAAPVQARGELVGALVVAVPHTLEPHETAALQLLARVLSLVAENGLAQKDLLQETLDRYREINLLYRVGETIAASLDLAQVNGLILNECVRLVRADEGAVMLKDRESGQLTVWASRGLDAVEDIGPGIPLGHEPAEQVFRSGETQVFEQPAQGRRKRPLAALLCVPLKTKDEVLGVISLAHTRPDRTFRVSEIRLLNALAAQAVVAIDNAQMFSDLSALHAELEEANRRLLELDRLKSSFLGVVTHELRSPVANIDFSLQVIERYGISTWRMEQQEQWQQLISLLQKAKEMIDNLVSFACLLSKQGDLFMTEVDFPPLVGEIAESLVPVARSRQVTLQVDTSRTVPPIMADKMRLAEAIYHLIHNGIKFNRSGGTVEVRYWPEDEGMAFEVQDTGVGIPAEKIKLLGDPFSQMADPLRRSVEGLGLGLALVKYVVHAHGGQLTISSQEGVGSRFGFWLPVDGHRFTGQHLATGGHNRWSPHASDPTRR